MKKNGILFLILVGLLTFTYFFQELGDIKKVEETKVNQNIVNTELMGDLIELKNSHVTLKRDKNKVFRTEKNHPVDPRKLSAFLEALSDLRVKETIDEINSSNEKDFFPSENNFLEFRFQRGKMKFILGNKLAFNQNFYVKIIENKKVKYVIAENLTAAQTAYRQEEAHNNDSRYNKFIQLLNWQAKQFREARVFGQQGLAKSELKAIEIKNNRNIPFQIRFNEGSTFPEPPKSVGIYSTMLNIFLEKALKLHGFDSYVREEELSDEVSTLMYILNDNRYYKFTLFKKYGNREGYFFADEKMKVVFEAGKRQAELFFAHVQEVWDLIPYRNQEDLSLINIGFGSEERQVALSFGNTFKAKTVGSKDEAVNKSFFHLSELLGKRADYLIFDSKVRQQSRKAFQLTIQQNKYQVLLAKGELVLWNELENFGYVWKVAEKYPIVVNFESYFL
ncbi:MAG: hypothetical protein GY909_03680 [Oligoflexia bacterium]|nr:hypothetical protein [Oligoflexia bacterium]